MFLDLRFTEKAVAELYFRSDVVLLFFPMVQFVPVSPWLNACLPRPPAVVPALPDLASAEQCQAVHKLVSVRSGSARPGPARVLILGLSEDPALNSSCNTGKRSNWGIFCIINSDEQPSHSPSHLPPSLTPTLFPDLSIFHSVFFP